ncbi:MAG: hypothetical protein AAB443_02810 [Patescibacteria group bacterium]
MKLFRRIYWIIHRFFTGRVVSITGDVNLTPSWWKKLKLFLKKWWWVVTIPFILLLFELELPEFQFGGFLSLGPVLASLPGFAAPLVKLGAEALPGLLGILLFGFVCYLGGRWHQQRIYAQTKANGPRLK